MKPYVAPTLTKADVQAIKLLAEGKADGEAQKYALNLIIDRLCDTYGLSYRPDDGGGDRDTAFAEGKRWVGLQLRRIIVQPMKYLVPEEEISDVGTRPGNVSAATDRPGRRQRATGRTGRTGPR